MLDIYRNIDKTGWHVRIENDPFGANTLHRAFAIGSNEDDVIDLLKRQIGVMFSKNYHKGFNIYESWCDKWSHVLGYKKDYNRNYTMATSELKKKLLHSITWEQFLGNIVEP